MIIIQHILLAFGIFVFFRIIGKLIYIIPAKKIYHGFLIRIYPAFEFSIWAIFIFFTINKFFNNTEFHIIFSFVIFLIIAFFVSWFFVKDFIAGIFIKMEKMIDINQKIKFMEIEGYITKIGYRTLIIKTDNGELIKVPFSKVSNSIISFPNVDSDSFFKHVFNLEINNNKPYIDYIEYIRFMILNTPWASVTKEPKITLVQTNAASHNIKIDCYTLNEEHGRKIETLIRKNFSSNLNDEEVGNGQNN